MYNNEKIRPQFLMKLINLFTILQIPTVVSIYRTGVSYAWPVEW